MTASKPKSKSPWRAWNPGWLKPTPNEQRLASTHRKLLRK